MTKKKFTQLKNGDHIYRISMDDSELWETNENCVTKLEVENIIRSTEGPPIYKLSIRTTGGTYITVHPNLTSYVIQKNENDEVNLSFNIYATTKEDAVDEARKLISTKMRLLGLIKCRINEAETSLILADSTLDAMDVEEEPSLEEFAEMALS